MSKKYTLLILMLAGIATGLKAQNSGRSINVLYLDGSDHITATANVERINIGEGTVSIVTTDGTVSSHNVSDIDRIWLNGVTSGICNSVKSDGDITITVTDGAITVDGATDKAVVKLYNIGGQRVAKTSCTAGHATISTAGMSAGTYIVKVDGMSKKLIKK